MSEALRVQAPSSALTGLPRWPQLWTRLSVVATLLGLPIGVFFYLDHGAELGGHMATLVAGYVVMVWFSAIPLAITAMAPLRRLQRLLDNGVAPLALPVDDVVRSLRLGERIFGMVLLSGVAVALAAGLGASLVPALYQWRAPLFVGGMAFGFIAACTQGYATQWLVIGPISEILLVDGRLDHLGQVRHVMVWHHLALLIATLGVAWPVLAASVLLSGAHDPIVFAPLFALYMVATTHQVMGILAIVTRGVGHLKERLQEVRDGDLQTQARVRSLDSLGILSADFNRMVEGLRQRELLKETFGRYVTKQVADEILAGRVSLGGEQVQATVLFSDIRGFTAMSESMSPTEVVAFLNEYLATMVDCVLEHGGILDKFIGDAVLAVFGAPVSLGSPAKDAAAAVACARAMGQRLDEMNNQRAERGLPAIQIGIGVHTGEVVAGNIGSPKRMEYTVIGDTVNVGSRLESLTKEHHRRTLFSGATAALVDDAGLVEVGTVAVRGRLEPLRIFGLADDPMVTGS